MNATPFSPPIDTIPHSYVIQCSTQTCDRCNNVHHWSTVFAKAHLKSRMGVGTGVTHLRAVQWPRDLYNLPIEQVNLPHTRVPFCHDCQQIDLGNWPKPPQPTGEIVGLYAPAIPTEARPKAPLGGTPSGSTRKAPPTLDDVLNMLA